MLDCLCTVLETVRCDGGSSVFERGGKESIIVP
jgi:hypothetical protein